MMQLRADDVLGVRSHLPRHAIVSAAEPLLSSFAQHCREVVRLLLGILETRLELPPGTLLALHQDNVPCGDFISLQHRAAEPSDESTVKKGEHTDFGSITMLFNWLGGLQIRERTHKDDTPGDWVYIKPVPGSCVINLADSLVKLTAGILKSNIHRVAPAPGPQAGLPRYSLVYFAHPNDDVELKPVSGGLVDAVQSRATDDETVITAAEWVTRRSLGDLRGVYTYWGGIEWRDNNDAVAASDHVQIKA